VKKYAWLLLLLPLLLLSACSPQGNPRQQISSIEDYVVFYGIGRADELAQYDLAIVQPETLTSAEIETLHQEGTLVVAYLSLGEVEPSRPWYSDGRFDPQWILGRNENWGSYYVDTGQSGWQALMVDITGELLDMGYDGIFMDTIDTVYVFPETTQGMIDLIHALRSTYPDMLMVQNRGFDVAEQVAADIDAVMFEDASTTYDFQTGEYSYLVDQDSIDQILAFNSETGLPILALDYAPVDNPGLAYRAVQNALDWGFIPAVSTINLDDIPDYGLEEDGPADVRVTSITAEMTGEEVYLVITVENTGLEDAEGVHITLQAGDQSAETTQDMLIGDRYTWRWDWPAPQEGVQVIVSADYADDGDLENNSLNWQFSSQSLAIEPILPYDQQRHRPSQNGADLIATALTSPIVIDGDLSDWEGYTCTTIDQSTQISYGEPVSWNGPRDLSGEVCYAWDSESLWIAFTIQDDAIVQRFEGSSIWKGDHIEFWFDTQLQLDFDSTEAGSDDYQLGISPGNGQDVDPGFYIWQPATMMEDYQNAVDWAVTITSTGYQGEIHIPVSVLHGLRLVTGQTIGASFEPSDTDTPGGSDQETMLSTAPQSSTNWGNPTYWNNLILQGTPTVTPQQTTSSVYNSQPVSRELIPLNTLPVLGEPADVSAVIGYGFNPGDASQPISAELLEEAQQLVRQAAEQGALWLDADTGITNYADAFLNDPALAYYPLAEAIITEAHRLGVQVFFYFSGTEIETPDANDPDTPDIAAIHPDWLQIDQNGDPMSFRPGDLNLFWLEEGNADDRMTPLSEGFREEIFARAERLAQLGADGIFVDVPYFFVEGDRWGDFSEYSAAAFRQATGLELPINLEEDGLTYYRWIDWRHQVWEDFFSGLRQRVQAANPETQVIVEEFPGADPYGSIETGLDPASIGSSVDIIAHEYSHLQEEGGAAEFGLADWQHTRDVYKWYQGMPAQNWSLCYATHPEDSRALAAITYLHQLTFWETQTPMMVDTTTGLTWRRELLAWVAQNAEYLNNLQPAAQVAVILSSRARDLSGASSMDDMILAQHALDAAGIPYVVIMEEDIEQIRDFNYVIFPNTPYARPEVLAALSGYQGTLLLVGESLIMDEWGQTGITPPAQNMSLTDAICQITTVPFTIEGGEGLYVEVYRQGQAVQIRLFNPDLDEDFQAEDRQVTLTFQWQGAAPTATQLDFLADETIDLPITGQTGEYTLTVTVGLMSVITLQP